MIPPNLMQLAKQGHPDAIAVLMNTTLQPKGVTAAVVRIGNYLHISFTAPRSLNQSTLVNFTRKGLQELQPKSIQTVKVYGLKTEQEQAIWVEEFCLTQPDALDGTAAVSDPAPTASASGRSLQKPRQALPLLLAIEHTWTALKKQLPLRLPWPDQPSINSIKNRWLKDRFGLSVSSDFKWFNHYPTIGFWVAILAFLVGGVVGVVVNLRSATTSEVNVQSMSPEPSPNYQQETEQYLIKMNRAQQQFYASNQRFAKTLEELERSATILAQSRGYRYQLTVVANGRSHLTATPKQSGLTSYAAVVIAGKSLRNPQSTRSAICKTTQPAQTPPLPLPLDGALQCPAGSSTIDRHVSPS